MPYPDKTKLSQVNTSERQITTENESERRQPETEKKPESPINRESVQSENGVDASSSKPDSQQTSEESETKPRQQTAEEASTIIRDSSQHRGDTTVNKGETSHANDAILLPKDGKLQEHDTKLQTNDNKPFAELSSTVAGLSANVAKLTTNDINLTTNEAKSLTNDENVATKDNTLTTNDAKLSTNEVKLETDDSKSMTNEIKDVKSKSKYSWGSWSDFFDFEPDPQKVKSNMSASYFARLSTSPKSLKEFPISATENIYPEFVDKIEVRSPMSLKEFPVRKDEKPRTLTPKFTTLGIESRHETALDPAPVPLQDRRPSFELMLHQDMPIAPIPRKVELTSGEKLIIKPGQRPKQVPFWTSVRLRFAFIWFFGFVCLNAQRGDLSIAIVCMVDHKYFSDLGSNATSNGTEVTRSELCPDTEDSLETGEFRWDRGFQGVLLGSYFWGYMVLQIPGGRLAERFGAKFPIAITTLIVASISLLSPVLARMNKYVFLIGRLVTGLCQGVMYPAAQAFWSRWSPLNERSRLIGLSYAGGAIGNAIVFPIGGYLCAYGFDNGWGSVFYVIGSAAFIWCLVWILCIYNSPSECPGITEIELKYIQASVGTRPKNVVTPWPSFVTSRAVTAIAVSNMCANYSAYMLITLMPTYMKDILKFDIKSNGIYSMLPYLWFWFFTVVSGMCADHLISREILSVEWTRKVMSAIGLIFPAFFLLGASYLDCRQQAAAMMMLAASIGFCGFQLSGFYVNHGDIAPSYAGTLYGITNTLATIPGIAAPIIVGELTTNRTQEEWQTVFYIAAAVNIFGAIFFALTGSGEVQEWAKHKESSANSELIRTLLEIKEESSSDNDQDNEEDRSKGGNQDEDKSEGKSLVENDKDKEEIENEYML